eukprot:TRINITY_DN33117_c0_g1_i1.p1 TRINITY_DN33117_c0_g1~~TRINITY_DN33117_c0_g1_i1.p1  ORF type:complete len:332 (+),score=27.63 TRINITY_DN33117_c0_g1_i1:130-996(+)
MTRLKQLEVIHAQPSGLADVCSCTSLQKLTLSGISGLMQPGAFSDVGNLVNLSELELEVDQPLEVGTKLPEVTSLQILTVRARHPSVYVPPTLWPSFAQVRELVLQRTASFDLSSLSMLTGLVNLAVVDVREKPEHRPVVPHAGVLGVRSLPMCPNLRTLNISFHASDAIVPQGVALSTSLQHLTLVSAEPQPFDFLTSLRCLTTLRLWDVPQLPSPDLMSHLTELWLSNVTCPDQLLTLTRLTSLKVLDLTLNELTEPNGFALAASAPFRVLLWRPRPDGDCDCVFE